MIISSTFVKIGGWAGRRLSRTPVSCRRSLKKEKVSEWLFALPLRCYRSFQTEICVLDFNFNYHYQFCSPQKLIYLYLLSSSSKFQLFSVCPLLPSPLSLRHAILLWQLRRWLQLRPALFFFAFFFLKPKPNLRLGTIKSI